MQAPHHQPSIRAERRRQWPRSGTVAVALVAAFVAQVTFAPPAPATEHTDGKVRCAPAEMTLDGDCVQQGPIEEPIAPSPDPSAVATPVVTATTTCELDANEIATHTLRVDAPEGSTTDPVDGATIDLMTKAPLRVTVHWAGDDFTVAIEPGACASLPTSPTSPTSAPQKSPRVVVAKAATSKDVTAPAAIVPTVGLGSAASFAVLAGSTITNTGPTTISGDIGLHPGTAVTGFGSVTQTGTLHVADAVASGAKSALATAYDDAAARPSSIIATELGGQTLLPGVYSSASGTFGVTGALILDGQNDPSAVWIFQTASTLITAVGSSVAFINGGSYCNVFWKVGSSATIQAATQFKGTIMALSSITLVTGARVDGRALARNGAVTMDTNVVTRAACGALPPPTPTPTPSLTPTPTPTPTPSVTPTVTPTPSVAPTVTPTVTPSANPTVTPSVTPTPSTVPTATATATTRPSATPSVTPTVLITSSPTPGPTPSDVTPSPPVTRSPRTGPPPLIGAPTTGAASGGSVGVPWLMSIATGPAEASPVQAPFRFAPLATGAVPLRAPPIVVPLSIRIPSLDVDAPLLGVGMTSERVMDAPMGSTDWRKGFWYRGGSVPGDPGTATIAGHVSGGAGSVFARLGEVRAGDAIVVHDARIGRNVRFIVSATRIYPVDEIGRAALTRIYGSGPVNGHRAQAAPDGGSHLTLITCAGDLTDSGYDHRLVVFAERSN